MRQHQPIAARFLTMKISANRRPERRIAVKGNRHTNQLRTVNNQLPTGVLETRAAKSNRVKDESAVSGNAGRKKVGR
jgi:hypothetical protein